MIAANFIKEEKLCLIKEINNNLTHGKEEGFSLIDIYLYEKVTMRSRASVENTTNNRNNGRRKCVILCEVTLVGGLFGKINSNV